MNTDLPIISTDAIDRTIQLVKDCFSTGAVGALTGPNGSGKTCALRAVHRRYSGLGLPGQAFYLRCCPVKGHTRGIKDLLDALGRKVLHSSGASVAYSVKLCLHELRRQGFNALLLDDVDLWGCDVLEGVIALRDAAHELSFPLVIVMAGASNPDLWLGAVASARSRTLKTEIFADMTIEQMLGVLRSWGADFESFVLNTESDREAVKIAKKVHAHVRGNFRKLSYFAALHRAHFPSRPVDAVTVEQILPRLMAA